MHKHVLTMLWTSVCAVLAFQCVNVSGFTTEDEARLRGDLAANQSVDVRPNATTTISLSFQLTSLSLVDIKGQQFGVTGWWSMRWTDTRLSWDKSNYTGIPVLQLDDDKLWTPTLVVDNSVNDLSAIDEDTIPVRVNDKGVVTWNPPGLLLVTCEMDITYFPFEEQTCSLQVTSFGFTIQELSIIVHQDGLVLTYYSPNGEWDLLDNWSDRDTFVDNGFEYSRVYFFMRVKRRPLYYGLNMLLPVVINVFLTIFVFLLPAESGEKIGYCLTVLLSFMVILTLIATDLPTTAKYTSLLEIYIAVALIMGGLSVLFSIIAINLHFRPEEETVPKIIRKVTRLGMFISCFNTCCKRKVKPEENGLSRTEHDSRRKYNSQAVDSVDDPLDNSPNRTRSPESLMFKPPWHRQGSGFGLRAPTGKFGQRSRGDVNDTDYARALSKVKGKSEEPEMTWQLVAKVMDAVLFRFYFLFLIVSTSVIMITLAA